MAGAALAVRVPRPRYHDVVCAVWGYKDTCSARAAVAKKMKSQRHLDPSAFDPAASVPAVSTMAAVFPVENKAESTCCACREASGGTGTAGGTSGQGWSVPFYSNPEVPSRESITR